MQKLLIVFLGGILVLSVLFVVYLSFLGRSSKTGRAPGMVSGKLTQCPDKPNCVCSEYPEHKSHYIDPIEYSGMSKDIAWLRIKQAIESAGGEIVILKQDYLAATFKVSFFGFVDDVECRLDTMNQQIQIRSASRVGTSDLGVNRARVKEIVRIFNANE